MTAPHSPAPLRAVGATPVTPPVTPPVQRPARRRRVAALLASAALVATPALAALPAQAARPATHVTVKIAKTKVVTGTSFKVTGTVSGRSAKAVVVLQRKAGKKWVSVRTGKVKASKRYAIATTARPGVTRYRVKVKGNARIRGAVTGAVKIRGVKASATGPSTTGPSSPVKPTGDAPLNAEVKRILDDTNAFRRKQGLAPLVHNAAMSTVATAWSRHMGEANVFDHNPHYSKQIPAGWRRAGENVAAGQAPGKVVDAWIASPGHRANLLGAYTHIGIGAVRVPGSPYGIYYTQNFATYPN